MSDEHDPGPPVLEYRTNEVGLGLLLLWLRETPGATLGDVTATAILEGWITPTGDTPGAAPDREAAHLEHTQLRERVRELEAALRAVMTHAPVWSEEGDRRAHCVFCGGRATWHDGPEPYPATLGRWTYEHRPGCTWVKAEARLGEEG
jgi:hypothetical protein